MTTHRHRQRRTAAAFTATLCLALPVSATARPADDPTGHPASAAATAGDATVAQRIAVGATGGDTPIDHPGAARAPQFTAPTRIEVVRPERTIVRDADELLPVVLASAALLVALGGCAVVLGTSFRRRRLGSTH